MNQSRNLRISAFRKTSGYLLWFSMPILILNYLLGGIILLMLLLSSIGPISIGNLISKILAQENPVDLFLNTGIDVTAKVICSVLLISFIGIFGNVLLHFQKLIECFYQGKIFNRTALMHARKAYKMNLYLDLSYLGIYLAMVIYAGFSISQTPYNYLIEWVSECLGVLIELGFLSLTLWALEIGTELNEDVELTI